MPAVTPGSRVDFQWLQWSAVRRNRGIEGSFRMFEEEFAKLPVEPPRRVASLPGLRLWAAIPKWALLMPLFFLSFFAVIPLSLMSADPAMRLAMGPTET